MHQCVDFDTVRHRVRFEQLLNYYQIQAKPATPETDYFAIACPFCSNGRDCLRVYKEQKVFRCFECGEKGDIIEFVSKIEGKRVRDAAIALMGYCGVISV
jgi:DNA primase